MPSSFHSISPPPQSLESTGEWGDLDSLLWSLDDPRWLTIGVYGIRGTEAAHATQFATLSKRIRLYSGSARATAGGTGFISVTVFPKGEATAVSSGRCDIVRGLHVAGASFATTVEKATAYRVRPASGSASAHATETEGPRRVRLLVAPVYAVSSENSLPILRVRCAFGESVVYTTESAMPSIKGHNWKDEAQVAGDWEQLPEMRQIWKTQESGTTTWRGIVQWP